MYKEINVYKSNIDGKFAELRDIWFSTDEKEFFEKVKENKKLKAFVEKVQKEHTSKELYNIAKKYINKFENGEVKKESQAITYEMIISACLYRKDYQMENEHNRYVEDKRAL